MLKFSKARRWKPVDLAIDLGTASTIVVEHGSGIVFDEPSLCCFRAYDAVPAFVTAGIEAQRFAGRVARPLKIVHPLREGVVSDMDAARELLRFATRGLGPRRRLGRARVVFGAPQDASPAERQALLAAANDAGMGGAEIVAEPLLAAAGAGFDVDEPRGRMIVDCGAGLTEAVIVSMNGICASGAVRGGGDALTQALIDHLRTRRRFRVGESSAEALKLEVSRLIAEGQTDVDVPIAGLDAASGLPRTIRIDAPELLALWERDLAKIVAMIRQVLRNTPPGLSEDIFEDGITLTGGAAVTALLTDRIREQTGVEARVADDRKRMVARGLELTLGRAA